MMARPRSRERLDGPPPIDTAVEDFTELVDRWQVPDTVAAARVGWPVDTLQSAARRDRYSSVMRRKERLR